MSGEDGRDSYVEEKRRLGLQFTSNDEEKWLRRKRLQLEQATWAESNRIDQIARSRLGMKFPETGEIVVVRP